MVVVVVAAVAAALAAVLAVMVGTVVAAMIANVVDDEVAIVAASWVVVVVGTVKSAVDCLRSYCVGCCETYIYCGGCCVLLLCARMAAVTAPGVSALLVSVVVAVAALMTSAVAGLLNIL